MCKYVWRLKSENTKGNIEKLTSLIDLQQEEYVTECSVDLDDEENLWDSILGVAQPEAAAAPARHR